MMMQAVVLQGEASNDSGLVKLAGFITNSGDISKKCEEVFPPDSGWRKLAHTESNGRMMLLALQSPTDAPYIPRKVAVYRREDHKFFVDLSFIFQRLAIATIDDVTVSESHGSFSMVLLYTERSSDA